MADFEVQKGWRHDTMRAQIMVICSRKLKIDGDGFLPADLEPAEFEKLGKMPKWSYCDRAGPEIVATKRADAERIAEELRKQLDKAKVVVSALERKLADATQRTLTLAQEEADAHLRVKQEAEAERTVDIKTLTWNQLRKLCGENGISAAGQDRDKLEAALALAIKANAA